MLSSGELVQLGGLQKVAESSYQKAADVDRPEVQAEAPIDRVERMLEGEGASVERIDAFFDPGGYARQRAKEKRASRVS